MTKYAKWAGYLLGIFMIAMGLMKFFADVPIFTIMEANLASRYGINLGFIDPQFKFVTGVLEMIAGVLLLLGQRFKGGAMSVLVIGGAIMTHIFVIGISTPESAAPDAAKSPMLFIVAVVFFLVALWVTKAHLPKKA